MEKQEMNDSSQEAPAALTPEQTKQSVSEADDDLPFPGPDDFGLPLPPDGGWGWIIVVASFFCNLIVDGVCYTFGIFYGDLLDYFQASKGQTALIGSMVPGLYYGVGPIVSVLATKFGCRRVTICGSILASVSFIISTFSNNVYIMILTYGVMGGIGFGLMYLPSIVIVGFYFDRKRALATGIAVCGSGIGTFVFAPLGSFLLDSYGWKGANIVLGAIILNGIVCGALFRPLFERLPATEAETMEATQTNTKKRKRSRAMSTASLGSYVLPGSIANFHKSDGSSYSLSTTSMSDSDDSTKNSVTHEQGLRIKDMFDFSLFKSIAFVAFCFSTVLVYIGVYTPFVYVTEKALSLGGVSRSKASLIISVLGICNTAGRLVAGWLADRSWADSLIIHNVSVIIAGLLTCLVPALNSYELLCLYAGLFGFFIAAFIALRSIVLVDLLGIQRLTSSFGITTLFQGIAVLVGSPISGVLLEATGSFTAPFIFSGSMFVLGGLICLPARRLAAWEAKRIEAKSHTSPVSYKA